MEYNFTTFAPYTQRGLNFPKSIIRLSDSGMIISANVVDKTQSNHSTNPDTEKETVRFLVNVDKEAKVIQLVPSTKGYSFLIRKTGNAHMNIFSKERFGLPVADYALVDEANLVFKQAE